MTVAAPSCFSTRDVPLAGDLSTILRRRLTAPDASVLGFYERSARTSRIQSQSGFLARAAGLGGELLAAGTRPGDRVVVSCAAPEASLLGFCAAVLIGAVPTIISGRVAFDGADLVAARIVEAMAMLGERSRLVVQVVDGLEPMVIDLDQQRITHLDLSRVGALSPADLGPLPVISAADPCHVQLTSGSTGEGRGIVVSHGSLLANFDALRDGLALGPGDVFAGWLPLNHDMGLVGQTLMALVDGIDLYLQSPFEFMADPLSWLRTISERGATFSASPNFGYQHVLRRAGDTDVAELDLSSWRSACCGAEPVSAKVAAAFSDRFAGAGLAPSAFTPCYGLAEATLAVTVTGVKDRYRSVRVTRPSLAELGEVTISITDGEPRDDEIDVVALGPAMLGISLRLIDEAGATVDSPLVCGEVVVSGTSVAAGTIGADGAQVPFPADGVHTGDIGFMEGGELFVVERTKNVLIRYGHNYSSAVLERTLARLAGVGDHNVLMLDTDLAGGTGLTGVIAVEPGADAESVFDAVELGLDQFELPPASLVAVARGSLPRTTSGKKRHVAAREMLRTGALTSVARRELRSGTGSPADVAGGHFSDLARQVLALIAEQVHGRGLDAPVTPSSRFVADLDFDSLALLELAMSAEDRLGIIVPERDLGELYTVGDLIAAAAPDRDGSARGPGVTASLIALEQALPQTYCTVDEQQGREVLIDGRWVAELASCNYLGLDLDPEVIAAIPAALATWGVHPSWTRAVASPAPYRQLEQRLAELVGVHDVIVFPTVTLLHFGVLPRLAGGSGAIVIDIAAHNSIHEAGALARARGTAVTTFSHGNLHDLEAKLTRLAGRSSRIIAVDGVYSMSGSSPDLEALVDIAERHDAVIYIDDAHGFGVLGHEPDAETPYGHGGGGLLRHADVDQSRIVYVAGMSKAFSSMAAFVSCRDEEERHHFETASTMIFSGPIPVASLASALAGLDVNAREGDRRRARLRSLTRRLLDGVEALGLITENTSGFPIVNVVLGHTDLVLAACGVLWEHGVLLTPAIFPAAPLNHGGLRFTLTFDHTEAQVDRLLEALAVVRSTMVLGQRLSTRTTAL